MKALLKGSVQLCFGGGVAPTAPPKPRAGAIGKVRRLIEERPWLTCGEIAEAVREPAGRVSRALNKLKHEGAAQRRTGLGAHRRTVWASTSDAGEGARAERLREVVAASDETMGRLASERLVKAFARAGAARLVVEC